MVLANAAAGSIFRSYNLILDSAAEREDLEALVLAAPGRRDRRAPTSARRSARRSRDPDVGVVGCVGAVGVRSIAWWEGSVTWASFIHRYERATAAATLPALSLVDGRGCRPTPSTGEVDTVDGFVLVLSPWVVRNVRFDESLGLLHGYDFDFCLQVREAGRKVVTADFHVVHHHSLELVSNPETWIAAHMRRRREVGRPDARRRRAAATGSSAPARAEAEAALARTEAVGRDAAGGRREEARLEHRPRATPPGARAGGITAPLRRLNAARRTRRRR